jgi:hypothetical protein
MRSVENEFEQGDWGRIEFVDHMRKIWCWNLMEQVGCGVAYHSGR